MPTIRIAPSEPPSLLPRNFHDVRPFAAQRAIRDPSVRAKLSGRYRKWPEITGICFHQTAVILGEKPRRYESLGAHVAVTRGGKIILVHDFEKVVYHGNGWNNGCVGIEIDGRYEGIEGDRSTLWEQRLWKRSTTLTEETISAAMELTRWICGIVETRGGKVRVLVAHRQSSMTRRNDPGSAIWRRIVLPLHEELGLGDGGPGFAIGGRPLPDEWTGEDRGVPY